MPLNKALGLETWRHTNATDIIVIIIIIIIISTLPRFVMYSTTRGVQPGREPTPPV